jgi:hypothetical protein
MADITGRWRVAGHQAPGISAMSPEESAAWLGKRAAYETARAEFDGETCSEPRYATYVTDADLFLTRFELRPEQLGVPGPGVCITEIGCPDEWVAPGSLLVHSGDALLTPWNGVFFTLERHPR